MSRARIEFAQHELEEICRRRAVKRLALFGSVLRDDFGPDSDIDVLIEFRDDFEGHRIYKIYDELEQLFGGRRVDLVDPKQLSPRLKRYVLENAEELYAAEHPWDGDHDADDDLPLAWFRGLLLSA